MGANLYWQPIKGRSITVGARSTFIETFGRVFGSMPYTLKQSDREQLYTAAAVWAFRGDDNPFQQLYDALESHEEISVWAEY